MGCIRCGFDPHLCLRSLTNRVLFLCWYSFQVVSSTNGELNVEEPAGAPSNVQLAARTEVEVVEEAKYVCCQARFSLHHLHVKYVGVFPGFDAPVPITCGQILFSAFLLAWITMALLGAASFPLGCPGHATSDPMHVLQVGRRVSEEFCNWHA